MSFLAPLFLLGGLAVALPVVFHLIRRTTKERTIFSSLMFMSPRPPRLTRRSRLEHLLLLALRCLVLCLLAVGFARPFIKQSVPNNPASGAAKHIVVLVDTSASMQRANLWADALTKVESVLRKTSPADEVAITTFDRQINPLLTVEQWNSTPTAERVAMAMSRLKSIAPGWAGTELAHALTSAAEALADNDGKTAPGLRQIVLVSDLQEGGHLDQLQGYEWPKGIEMLAERLKARHVNNAGLQLATDADAADSKLGASVRVRVSNAAESKREQFQVGWARLDGRSFAGEAVNIYVPPGQSRILSLPSPSAGTAAERILLQGDEEDFDNSVFVVPPETARLSILYLGSDSESDARQPLYFLQRAFQETRRQSVQVLDRPPAAPLNASEAQAATLLLATEALPEQRARALHDQVAAGKTLLLALKNPAAAATLAQLVGVDSVAIEEAHPNNYAMLAEIDFRHPLFAPFADPRYSDFTKIHFWKYRRLDLTTLTNALLVAKFDSGDPAIVDVPVGRGRVIVLTSGWGTDDSQLALSTKFVPLVYALLDYSGVAAPAPLQYHVGDVVALGGDAASGSPLLSVRAPDGSQLNLSPNATNFSQTMTPGIYSVSSQPAKRFAVNLEANESRTSPLPVDELERFGAPVASASPAPARVAERKVRLQNTELESRQKLWRWLIVVTLAVLLIETWLAGRTARHLLVPANDSNARFVAGLGRPTAELPGTPVSAAIMEEGLH